MRYLILSLELLGTVAFAVSGAVVGIKKNMDIFGVCILGVTTACGGGVLRDVLLGQLPPAMFCNGIYALSAIVVSVIMFIIFALRYPITDSRIFDAVLLVTDSVGLGVFTVSGISAVFYHGHGDNAFFTIFLGVCTGIGGGLIRDVISESTPLIFVKHIYACASIIGAVICYILWNRSDPYMAMAAGSAVIVVIRLLAAHFRWNLPRIRKQSEDV